MAMNSWSFLELFNYVFPALMVLATLGGIAVCGIHFRVSAWMWVVLLGLVGHLLGELGGMGAQIAVRMMIARTGTSGLQGSIGAIFLLIRIVNLISWVTFLGGLALVFSDLRRRLTVIKHRFGDFE